MADNYAICLLGAMDSLWFHQIVLFSEPNPFSYPKTLKTLQPISEFFHCPSSNNSQTPLTSGEEISSVASTISLPQDDSKDKDREKEIKSKERPKKLDLITTNTRSHSSSPLTKKSSRNRRYKSAVTLQKTMSCKSVLELELEEVKGFMDLGFTFQKEHLSPRMMSVIPGLQRLEGSRKNDKNGVLFNFDEVATDDGEEEDDKRKRGVLRPYLSEAWLIKRPDSPLLNLRIPKVSAATDMRKHLKYWARTVVSVIQQEYWN